MLRCGLFTIAALAAMTGCSTLLVGCSSSAPASPPTSCDDLSVKAATGCLRAGPSACAPGFTLDSARATCEPILPAEPCARGTFAVPGETACHGIGTLDVPAASTDVFVDASAAPGGDGSAARPFQTVQAGVDAATAGFVVRVRGGAYAESVRIKRPVRLIGEAAEKVEIRGVGTASALIVTAEATLAGLALTGPGQGLSVTDATVTASHLWIHDTQKPGLGVDRATGAGVLTVSHSLIESCAYAGAAVFGATLSLSSSVVRDTALLGGAGGPGVLGQLYKGTPATIVVDGSLVERNREVGVGVAGGSLTVTGSVVRDTGPTAKNTVGTGILASFDQTTKTPPTLVVRGCLVASNLEIGVSMSTGAGTIERTVVRGTRGAPARAWYGVGVQADPGTDLTVRESVLEDNQHLGLAIFGARATVERTIVRGTRAFPGRVGGVGIGVDTVKTLEAPSPQIAVRESLIVDNQSAGLMLSDGRFDVSTCVVRGTAASDGHYGDGLILSPPKGSVEGRLVGAVEDLLVENNARAGIGVFGGELTVKRSRLRCNAFDLQQDQGTLVDLGENACGCASAGACKVASEKLEPVPFPDPR